MLEFEETYTHYIVTCKIMSAWMTRTSKTKFTKDLASRQIDGNPWQATHEKECEVGQ